MKTRQYMIPILLILLSASCAFEQSDEPQPSAAQAGSEQSQSQPQDKASGRLVTLDLKDVPIRQAIEALFAGSGHQYIVVPDDISGTISGTVTIKLAGVPFDNALRTLANTAGLKIYDGKGGVFVLGPDPQRGLTSNVQQTAPQGLWETSSRSRAGVSSQQMSVPRGVINILPRVTEPGLDRRFDVTLEQANLFEAIKQLMELGGRDYVLDLGVSTQMPSAFYPRITAKMRNATLNDTLSALAKTSGLTTEKAANTYIFRFRSGYPSYGTTGYAGPYGVSNAASGFNVRGNMPTFPCAKCGQGLQPDWKFCPMCGSPAARPGAEKR